MFAFFGKPKQDPTPLFEAALAASRAPSLYRDYAVPDTFDGRFELLLLHLWPVFKAIEGQDALSQKLYDLTFKRMELALRETGVGDLGVGKQVRAMMRAFYGRLSSYTACGDDAAWREALRRNVYGTIADETFKVPDGMVRYAKYLANTKVLLEDTGVSKVIYPE